MAESGHERKRERAPWRFGSSVEVRPPSTGSGQTTEKQAIALEPLASRVAETGPRQLPSRIADWSFRTIGGAIPSRVTGSPTHPRFGTVLLLLVLLACVAVWPPTGLRTVTADAIGRLRAGGSLQVDVATPDDGARTNSLPGR
jgi:hypothetical protein